MDVAPGDLTDLIQRNIELMAFPPSAREAATYAEVIALPRVVARRPPTKDLLEAGFVPYDCHRNCADQAANDPKTASRHVVGWLPYGEDLILHSIAEIAGRWLCLTPQFVASPSRFDFIPDPHIEWRYLDDGVSKTVFRHGHEMPEALRKDPHRHIRMRDEFLAMVKTGMSPLEARDAVARNDSVP
ncbi:hypothetical protein ASD04_11340 [Devosia sp. Root436]|uniref:hypothetical protein n=1 Tax=Devosia sp. Root436 TaxID=1736537 RepID=UPI0006FE30A2|nr:hypothetical protein [Devosia sp. Root436]KQX38206.1 hypothetical protein ASD04_11340 [Devosia sp. Root436]